MTTGTSQAVYNYNTLPYKGKLYIVMHTHNACKKLLLGRWVESGFPSPGMLCAFICAQVTIKFSPPTSNGYTRPNCRAGSEATDLAAWASNLS